MTASPFQGVATEQKAKNRKIHSHSHSLITTAQALLGTPGEVQPDMFLCSAKNNISVIMGSGHTQDPRQDSTVTSRVPPEVPDPPSYRVESVSLATLYQSYNPISHTPPRITIHAHPPCFLQAHLSFGTRSPHSIPPPERWPPSPPLPFHF